MKQLVLYSALLLGVSVVPAVAQTCNTGTNVVTPQSSLNNKVPGPPSPTSTAALRYTFGSDITSDCDSDGSNGGATESVHQAIIQPSCNFVGLACVNDPGGDDTDPLTPAVAFLSLDATTCLGGLANITVDISDPFSVKFNFTVPLNFPPNTNCSLDVTLNVREMGDATTPGSIAQRYSTDGVCLCSPEMPATGTTSTQLFLTCPPCSTNFCAPEHCSLYPIRCVSDPTPDCSNLDNDLCTSGSCDPSANGGNGACVNGAPTVCDDNNACTTDSCNPATGCVFTAIACEAENPALGCENTPGGGLPRPVTLRLAKHPEIGNIVVTWDAEPDTVYDVVRGTISDLIDGGLPRGATCRSNDIPGPPTPGTASFSEPLSDDCTGNGLTGCWYLLRAQNACGTGPWSSFPLDTTIFNGMCSPDCACPDDDSSCTVDGCDASNVCHHYCAN